MAKIKTFMGLGLATLLAACHESYPGLYATITDADNPNPEVTDDRLPVMISLTDPLYGMVANVRGLGPFGHWEDADRRNVWLNAGFGVYAFLTGNFAYGGAADYTRTEEPWCLVNDRKAHITAACEFVWDGSDYPYWNNETPDHQYNFFLYHTGDARQWAEERREATRITKFVEVNGTQDLISAYAYPESDDIDKLADNAETIYLLNHAGDLVYSTRTARLLINPHFHVRHEMAQLEFSVKDSGKSAGRIEVESVGVLMPVRGSFVVAADWPGVGEDWSDRSRQPETGVTWDETTVQPVYVRMADWKAEDDFDAAFDRERNLFNPPVTVSDTETAAVQVGKPILVPTGVRLGFCVHYRYYSDDPEDEEINGKLFTVNYESVRFDDGTYFMAERGKVHAVQLNIYGPARIGLMVDGRTLGWQSGGGVDVGDPDAQ